MKVVRLDPPNRLAPQVFVCAIPISVRSAPNWLPAGGIPACAGLERSEEHTSELQSPCNLVCRLLLEKKKTFRIHINATIYSSNTVIVGACGNCLLNVNRLVDLLPTRKAMKRVSNTVRGTSLFICKST